MKIQAILIPIILSAGTQILPAMPNMVGDVAKRSAKIWFASDDASEITAVCSPKNSPETKIVGHCESICQNSAGNIGILSFENLDAGTEYSYVITEKDSTEVSGGSFKTQADFEDRTPPPDFTFAVLGANHINDAKYDPPFRTPGGEYEIFEAVRKSNPDFVIWTGGANNLRKADIGARGAIISRTLDLRKLPEAEKLLNTRANYGVASLSSMAGTNDDSFSSSTANSREIFNSLWANPRGKDKTSASYAIRYSDAEIFVLDDVSNRSNLDYGNAKPKFLGESQLNWLIGALSSSRAKFKIIVMNTPIANPVKSSENFTNAVEERKALMDFLVAKKITGVLLIAGNKPYGEYTRMVRAGAYPLFEASPAPLTARPSEEIKEMNYFRVPSSSITKRAFLQVKVDGAENARAVTFTYFDSKGEPIFTSTVKENELQVFD